MQKTVYWIISLLILVDCGQSERTPILPFYQTAAFTPIFITSTDSISILVNHQVRGIHFATQLGDTLTDAALNGKIHVANFFFTSCGGICPAIMGNLQPVVKTFQDDPLVQFLSFSVTPWRDSVPRLKQYAEIQGISADNWHLLTGERAQIYRVARDQYFAEMEEGLRKDPDAFLHTEHVLLVDRTGRIRGIYNGTLQLDMQQLQSDIQLLKAE